MTTSTQSAKSILDSLGTPPQEVCLDWAWQLKSFESVADAEPLTWADVEIDPEGMLIPPQQ